MAQVVEIPLGLAQFQLSPAVHDSAEPTLRERLQFLLDRQDTGTQLAENERLEAEGLVELTEFLSLLRLRSNYIMQMPTNKAESASVLEFLVARVVF